MKNRWCQLAIQRVLINKAHFLVIFVFLCAYLFLSVSLHYRYNTTEVDLAQYTQKTWLISQGRPWDIGSFKTFDTFGDHFVLHLFWIALFFRFWPDATVLIIVQTLAFVFSGLPIYYFALAKLKDKIASLFILIIYLIFYGFQAAAIFPFHAATLSTFFIAFTLWFMYRKNWFWYFIFLLLALAAKEDVATLGVVLGIYLLLFEKEIRAGLLTFFLSAAWFYVVILKLMPYLAGHPYVYLDEARSDKILNPILLLKNFFFPIVKTRTLLTLFASFGFLPLLSLGTLIQVAPFLLARFESNDATMRWLPWMHYSANQAPILGFGLTLGIISLFKCYSRITKNFSLKLREAYFIRIYLVLTFFLTLSVVFLYKMPLPSLLKPSFYLSDSNVDTITQALKLVPADYKTSVATQSSLLPHLATRNHIYLYPYALNRVDKQRTELDENAKIEDYAVPDADYIILSKHAFNWRPNKSRFNEVINYVKTLSGYKLIFDQNGTVVLKKV